MAIPAVTVQDVQALAGGQAVIPIDFENDGTVVGLQIDLRLPADQLDAVVPGECFRPGFGGINGCRQLPPPRDDIVRYAIVSPAALPSGRLANLLVTVSGQAVNGLYALDLLDNDSLAGGSDGNPVAISLNDGSLRITGGLAEPPDEPPDDPADPIDPTDPNPPCTVCSPPAGGGTGGVGGGGAPVPVPVLDTWPPRLVLILCVLVAGLFAGRGSRP